MATFSYVLTVSILVLLSHKAFSDPYDLSVTDVQTTSAVLHWHISEDCEKIDMVFKIYCSGLKQGNTDPYSGIDVVIHYAPKEVNHLIIGGMKGDYIYSCIVIEELSNGDNRLSYPLHFRTKGMEPSTVKPEDQEPEQQMSHTTIAHLSLAVSMAVIIPLLVIGCTLLILAAIIVRDQNELKKESSRFESVVIACSNKSVCNQDLEKCASLKTITTDLQTPCTTTHESKSGTTIDLVSPRNIVYYTASESDLDRNEGADEAVIKSDVSSRYFCTPPDIEFSVPLHEKQDILSFESSVLSIPPKEMKVVQSLSVFSSSSSIVPGDANDFGVDIDISSIA